MTDAVRHRGPDDEGVWSDGAAGIGLGHRRLSIVDLSSAGHQPMTSKGGRYVISYNGEIYNFRELARELREAGRTMVGGSDTAVLLEACALWGVRRTVDRLNGMFAFALWDRQERALTLVRDRLGIKPMVWARAGELFAFGSDLAALEAAGCLPLEIDPAALVAYFRYAYVPAPATIYKNAFKLPPGHLLTVPAVGEPRLERYWDLRGIAVDSQADPLDLSTDEAADRVEALLGDAVSRQMVSDVPLGAFLSGGIDSATVVALMQAKADRPVQSFTIGFADRDYDERAHARRVADHLGTDHTDLIVTAADALSVVPDLARRYDEPFADSSQIPTLLLSSLARRHVTVALSGDGGDELFAGYNRHLAVPALWRAAAPVPRSLRRGLTAGLGMLGPGVWERLARVVPAGRLPPQAVDKGLKLISVFGADGPEAMYRLLVSQWQDPREAVFGAAAELPQPEAAAGLDPMGRLQLLDTATYLPDDILTKVDRASMAVGLEVRVPLLDHRLMEFAWRLPRRLLVDGGSKAVLRRVLYRHVPRELVDRPKSGFAIPLAAWLRGPLRDWAEDLLSDRALARDGLLNPAPIRRIWSEHLQGRRNHQHRLWPALMFQAWSQEKSLRVPVYHDLM